MSVQKSYAVFGLGRYGMAVAQALVNDGAQVLAVDAREDLVNAAAATLPLCKCADVTNPEVLSLLGISNMDVVIISMASHLEASVMAVMLCKEAGVETVIAKCSNETHRRILLKVGADQVVIPESESGTRLAKNLLSSGFVDMVELAENVSLVELPVRAAWVGETLISLNLRKKYGINVVAIQEGDKINVTPDPAAPLTADQALVIIADTAKLRKLREDQ